MRDLRETFRDISTLISCHYDSEITKNHVLEKLREIYKWCESKESECEKLKRENYGLKQSVRNKSETLEKLGGYHISKLGKGRRRKNESK